MAEFGEVMRQFRRMCDHLHREHKCPMGCQISGLCTSPVRRIAFDYPGEMEKTVMQWAAEHPEPVYPTWEEWLTDMGVFEPLSSKPKMMQKNVGQIQLNGIPVYAMPTTKVFVPIPADIAEKLGIQLKEG